MFVALLEKQLLLVPILPLENQKRADHQSIL